MSRLSCRASAEVATTRYAAESVGKSRLNAEQAEPRSKAAAQAVEHYEISRYGTLKTWANELGLSQAVKLLDATLAEEKKTDADLTKLLQANPHLSVLDIDPGPTPTQERMSLALLEAVAQEKLRPGAHVVALYNGISVEEDLGRDGGTSPRARRSRHSSA